MNEEFLAGRDYDGAVWDQHDFTGDDLAGTTFSSCTFQGCDLSGLRLSATRWERCRLVECNLSNTVLDHTRFDGVVLDRCKLVGLNFGAVDPLVFELSLLKCLLRYVNFSQIRWRKAIVRDCEASDSDFRGAQMAGADFRGTRFRACRFHAADLSKADFSGAEGYDLDLRTENLKKAIFSLPEALNLLAPFDLDLR
jgi:fluoroquinolone resistance protein